ncbi:unnamed protein product [Didymodactylos carnosus]|uniref:RRM domain-containing protein n=1 Tax=Didymodactylos carnosus TaxID=1234261 RepID=A0A8S2FSZ6_9BILA|nr:unnamed protein product [Didymodactylos carnosus]CAF4334860.1 unnamed protein product [Didymodactylos carnosus]
MAKYVGNLENTVTEDLLLALFTQIGPCKGCKIIHEVRSLLNHAFLSEFNEHQTAAHALLAMNKRLCMGKKLASSAVLINKRTYYFLEHFHIFVGDLAPEIDQNTLRDAFSPFGDIS